MIKKLLRSREAGVVIILILMAVSVEIGSRTNHDRPFFERNIERIAQGFSIVAIAAIGGCIVIIAGGIDLSVGSVMGLSAVMAGYLCGKENLDPVFGITIGIFCGMALGVLSGLLIGVARIVPFIVTLGMMSVAYGLSFLVTGGHSISLVEVMDRHAILAKLANYTFVILLTLAVLASIYMKRFVGGRYVYALGANEEAARFSGLNIQSLKIYIYGIAGFFAAVAGICYALKYGTAAPATGRGYELQVIAACIVGGASFAGGQGSIPGAMMGALVLYLLEELLVVYNVKSEYKSIAYGLTIILAAILDQLRHGKVFEKIFLGKR
jgi:ribose transport system permease protein